MKRWLRWSVRILVAAVAILAVVILSLRVVITQPTWTRRNARLSMHADPERLRDHVEFLAGEIAPRSYRRPENLAAAADYIRGRFDASGGRVAGQPYEIEGQRHRNLLLQLGPAEGEHIIVGAHYDVAGLLPGADDNASGVAGLLELARLLAPAPLSSPVDLVAYSTEEPPFFGSSDMGSAVHAAMLARDGMRVRAMISLEMIGYFTETQPAPFRFLRLMYPSSGDFILVAGRWADRPLIREVKQAFRGVDGLRSRSYCGPTAIGTDLSDQRNYWARGYTGVMITDTAFIRNPNYHTASDTPDTLDYHRMARVVDGVANAVLWLQDNSGP